MSWPSGERLQRPGPIGASGAVYERRVMIRLSSLALLVATIVLAGCDEQAHSAGPPPDLDIADCLLVAPNGTAVDLRSVEGFQWHETFPERIPVAGSIWRVAAHSGSDSHKGQESAFTRAWRGAGNDRPRLSCVCWRSASRMEWTGLVELDSAAALITRSTGFLSARQSSVHITQA